MAGLLLLLTMVNVGDVTGQQDCVSDGPVDHQVKLCPRVYIVPAQPPLTLFYAGCDVSIWIDNQQVGQYTPILLKVHQSQSTTAYVDYEGDNFPVVIHDYHIGKSYIGGAYISVANSNNARYENNHLWIMIEPNMTMVTGKYWCLRQAIKGQLGYHERSPLLSLVLLADPSHVILSIHPKQAVYLDRDEVKAQCRGVTRLQESSVMEANLRLQYRQKNQAWINVEWHYSQPSTVVQPKTDVGIRVVATNQQFVHVCALLTGCTSCVLSLRCMVELRLHVFEDQASAIENLAAQCTLRDSTESPQVSTTQTTNPSVQVTNQSPNVADVQHEVSADGKRKGNNTFKRDFSTNEGKDNGSTLLYAVLFSGLAVFGALMCSVYYAWNARRVPAPFRRPSAQFRRESFQMPLSRRASFSTLQMSSGAMPMVMPPTVMVVQDPSSSYFSGGGVQPLHQHLLL